MKTSLKRKVHAQRKFAQGAFVPSLGGGSGVVLKSETATPLKEDRSIIHSNLSARGLLDIVSFQSMHSHSNPVVVLERMPARRAAAPQPGAHKAAAPPAPPRRPSGHKAAAPPAPPPPPRAVSVASSAKLRVASMKLRSRSSLTKTIKKRRIMKRRLRRPTRKAKKSGLKLRLKRVWKRMASSDVEDDRPLKYLKLARRETNAPESEVRSTRASSLQDKSVSGTTDNIDNDVGSGRVTRSTSQNEQSQFQMAADIDISTRVTRSSGHQEKVQVDIEVTGAGRVTRSSGQHEKVQSEKSDKSPKSAPDPKTFKEPAVPSRYLKSSAQPKRPVPVASASRDHSTATAKSVGAVKSQSQQYYGSSGIERWLKSSNKDSKEETSDIEFEITSAVEKENSQTNIGSVLESRASPCPSVSLRTVRDVISAAPSIMSQRCHKCQTCKRITIVENMTTGLMRSRRASGAGQEASADDVYEFDGADDAANPPPFFFQRKRAARAAGDEAARHFYLDLQINSPHIIEMTSVAIPNSSKRMWKARLIPRSEAQTSNFIEHENLLDQLLQTLVVNVNNPPAGPPQTPSVEESTVNSIQSSSPETPTSERPERVTRPAKRAAAKPAKLVEAPTFYPTEAEFTDPIKYIEKIAPTASKYGLCKIVAPANFKPKCILNDDLKFKVTNHYVARLYSRWGKAAREVTAMRAYLATQNINFNRVPLLESLEVNLPKLYAVVQNNGGLRQVMENKRWGRVAEAMRFTRGPNTEKTLDSYYVKYLLPYDTASNNERTLIKNSVEKCWNRRHRKLVKWALNPLHQQKKLLGESDSSDEELAEDPAAARALLEAEDCVVAGRPMNLSGFKKVASHAKTIYMDSEHATVEDIEKEYWRLVLYGTEHVCVNGASIDTAASGYGFSRNKTHPCGKHPWNLKMLSSNPNNVLRSLGSVVGVTVPTLHLGMIFSTCCWHRDPHGLPWMEYMHEGPTKIWYGIPDEQSDNFRKAVEVLCPTSCQNKHIWLSSDITMIPPNLLREHRVSLSHTVQNPGEFIVVFPKAYSCSISTGFTVSESVYFATNSWLKTVHEVFQELRASCEPSTFSLEQLLIALARDPRSSLGVLHTVHSSLTTVLDEETRYRQALANRGLMMKLRNQSRQRSGAPWNVREEAECQICRCTLYLSKVTGVLSKKSELCLLHAHRIVEARNYSRGEVSRMEVINYYSEKQLEEIMNHLKRRLAP